MSSIDLQHYGRMEQQVEQLKEDMDIMKKDVATIKSLLEQANGGWKTVMLVGGAVSFLSGFLVWVTQHLSFIK